MFSFQEQDDEMNRCLIRQANRIYQMNEDNLTWEDVDFVINECKLDGNKIRKLIESKDYHISELGTILRTEVRDRRLQQQLEMENKEADIRDTRYRRTLLDRMGRNKNKAFGYPSSSNSRIVQNMVIPVSGIGKFTPEEVKEGRDDGLDFDENSIYVWNPSLVEEILNANSDQAFKNIRDLLKRNRQDFEDDKATECILHALYADPTHWKSSKCKDRGLKLPAKLADFLNNPPPNFASDFY